jgi:prepilin-type N-terminal cleavage/methylation domain-containing protein
MRVVNMDRRARDTRRSAFSLIELVVVVVIIGIIAAIAIPKMSRGAAGAADSAMAGDLKLLRQAVDMYNAEHAGFPLDPTNIANQLTQYSNSDGTQLSASKNATNGIVYGPYLRTIPALPAGPATLKNTTGIGASTTASNAWFYDSTTNAVTVNPAAGNDSNGTAYSTY